MSVVGDQHRMPGQLTSGSASMFWRGSCSLGGTLAMLSPEVDKEEKINAAADEVE